MYFKAAQLFSKAVSFFLMKCRIVQLMNCKTVQLVLMQCNRVCADATNKKNRLEAYEFVCIDAAHNFFLNVVNKVFVKAFKKKN